MELFKHPEAREPLQIKKRDIQEPDTSTLTEMQYEAYKQATDYVFGRNNLKSFLLRGSAGTGKSYTVATIIEFILAESRKPRPIGGRKLKDVLSGRPPGFTIACCATTNKAVKITYRMAKYFDTSIHYKTVHSLLGLKEVIGRDGKVSFKQDDKKIPDLSAYNVILVDEVSMLPNELLIGSKHMKGLYDYIEEGLKVIFIGDDAQIPPVNSQPSAVFQEDVRDEMKMGTVELTEIMRQAAGNPIIDLATRIRAKLHLPRTVSESDAKLYDGDKGVYVVSKSDENGLSDMAEIIEHVFTSENYKLDIDYGKIIAYTNNVVNIMNGVVRDYIYGAVAEGKPILEGERLIVDSPVMDQDDPEKIILPTNEEITVLSYEIRSFDIETGESVSFYDTEVEYTRMDNSKARTRIRITTNEGYLVLQEVLQEMVERAKALNGSVDAYAIWRVFYRIKRQFAEVSYAYAITAHRSQGSTYTNAIVLEYNLDRVRAIRERQCIKYTAFTRASDRLFVITE